MPNQPQVLTIVATLVVAVIGAVIALVTTWLNNRHNSARLELQFKHEAAQKKALMLRERGEELYVLVENFLNGLMDKYLNTNLAIKGDIDYNRCNEMNIADSKEHPVNFSRLEFLIKVDFPSTLEAYTSVLHGRDRFNRIAGAHKQAYEMGDMERGQFLKPFNEAMQSINTEGEALKKQILECIRAI